LIVKKQGTESGAAAPAAPATKAGKKNALFVMFTNIKIFRDDKPPGANATEDNKKRSTASDHLTDKDDGKLKNNLNLLCPAELDTLEFAQSISSTTQSGATAAAAPAAPAPSSTGGSYNNSKYKLKRFNMKELTHKQKKHNARTHKNKSRKLSNKNLKARNNNHKGRTLFARRSKKYYN
jgi:hypothetical protein